MNFKLIGKALELEGVVLQLSLQINEQSLYVGCKLRIRLDVNKNESRNSY